MFYWIILRSGKGFRAGFLIFELTNPTDNEFLIPCFNFNKNDEIAVIGAFQSLNEHFLKNFFDSNIINDKNKETFRNFGNFCIAPGKLLNGYFNLFLALLTWIFK